MLRILRAGLNAWTASVFLLQIFQILLFAVRFHHVLVSIDELQYMIQCFFASQLILEVASFFDLRWV